MKSGSLLAFLAFIVLVALIVVFHAPGLNTGFLSDDFMILGHLHQRGWSGDWARSFLDLRGVLFYRPLLTGSYALDRAVWDLNPWGYHFTNLLLHLLVVLVVFQVGRRLTGRWGVGFMAAALVGLNPLNPNTVTWIAGRVSLLGTLFPLFTILAFLAWRRRPRARYLVAAVGSMAVGLSSKESAAVVPLFLLLVDFLLPRPRARWAIHGWLWALLVVYLAGRWLVLGALVGGYGGGDPLTSTDPWRALGELLASVVRALVPFSGARITGSPWIDSGLTIAVGGMLAGWIVVWFSRRAPNWRPVLVALAWAAFMVALFYPAWELALANAERWYPALAGVSLALAVVLGHAGRGGWIPFAAAVLIGLPALRQNEQDYRETGALVRRLLAEVKATPVNGPLLVNGLPLTRAGAPFLHFGLADALAPPFQEQRIEVFPVHATFVTLGDCVNPIAYVLATQGEVTVLQCDADGRIQGRVGREFLLGYEGFRDFFKVWSGQCLLGWRMETPRGWLENVGISVRAPAGYRVVAFLVTPAGGLRLTGTIPEGGTWSKDLGPSVMDYLNYPGCHRAYVAAFTLDARNRVSGLRGMWIAR